MQGQIHSPPTTRQSVWEIESCPTSHLTLVPPPPDLTEACEKGSGTCCKDLKGEDDRHLIHPDIIRDVIVGLSDGLTVPFALTAGLSSLGSSRLVVTAGLAELCAGAISMGVGGYLASRAELDHYHYVRRRTSARVFRSCNGEMAREIHAILGPFGIKTRLSRLIVDDLQAGIRTSEAVSEGIELQNKEVSDKREAVDDGVTPFLLRFGEGLDEVPTSRLYISAITIGLSYFIGGLIPLIPYFITKSASLALYISVGLTVFVLLVFGLFKTYFTGAKGGVWGYVYGAISTAVVGGLAAGAAFGLVKAMHVKE